MTTNEKYARNRKLWTAVGSLTAVGAVVSALFAGAGGKANATANTAPPAIPVSVAAVAETDRAMSVRTVERPPVSWDDNLQTPRRE